MGVLLGVGRENGEKEWACGKRTGRLKYVDEWSCRLALSEHYNAVIIYYLGIERGYLC
jgi:hypothetical protein